MEFPLQQGNHEQGQHAVEGVDADLLVGPVEAGRNETKCGSFIVRKAFSTRACPRYAGRSAVGPFRAIGKDERLAEECRTQLVDPLATDTISQTDLAVLLGHPNVQDLLHVAGLQYLPDLILRARQGRALALDLAAAVSGQPPLESIEQPTAFADLLGQGGQLGGIEIVVEGDHDGSGRPKTSLVVR